MSTEPTFTPGPWKLNGEFVSANGHYDEPRIFSVADEDNPKYVASLAVGRNWEHDGNLIAVAPEMYEAMAEFVHRCDIGEVRSRKTYAKFKAILEKVIQ